MKRQNRERSSNSTPLMLAAFVREWGGVPVKYPKVKDDAELLEQALGRAADGM